MKRFLTVACLCLLPCRVYAATADLAWEFPRATIPQPAHFALTLKSETGTDHYTVALSPVGACQGLGEVTEDTYCATLPQCPPDGKYTLTVEAVWGEGDTTASEPVSCTFTGLAPCKCFPMDALDPAPRQPKPKPPDPWAPPAPPEMPMFPNLPRQAGT